MAYCGCDPCRECKKDYFDRGVDEEYDRLRDMLESAAMPMMSGTDFVYLCKLVSEMHRKLAVANNNVYLHRRKKRVRKNPPGEDHENDCYYVEYNDGPNHPPEYFVYDVACSECIRKYR